MNFSQAVDQAAAAVPARWRATLLIWIGLGIEVVMSLAILTGVADRLAAFILAGYCLITALLWKQFWKAPDFRLQGAQRRPGDLLGFPEESRAGRQASCCSPSARTQPVFTASGVILWHRRIPMPHSSSRTDRDDRPARRALLAFVDGR